MSGQILLILCDTSALDRCFGLVSSRPDSVSGFCRSCHFIETCLRSFVSSLLLLVFVKVDRAAASRAAGLRLTSTHKLQPFTHSVNSQPLVRFPTNQPPAAIGKHCISLFFSASEQKPNAYLISLARLTSLYVYFLRIATFGQLHAVELPSAVLDKTNDFPCRYGPRPLTLPSLCDIVSWLRKPVCPSSWPKRAQFSIWPLLANSSLPLCDPMYDLLFLCLWSHLSSSLFVQLYLWLLDTFLIEPVPIVHHDATVDRPPHHWHEAEP
ncbi:hypothetical protein M514_07509 [Trichuris suis]|uniref:Uncharacterized protein n=1 Tax=Trichuris suis TaxID=68888 RepID=A0A085NE72_9BILA|nr:hypothetical protein M514_07509 [Trichuris suis]